MAKRLWSYFGSCASENVELLPADPQMLGRLPASFSKPLCGRAPRSPVPVRRPTGCGARSFEGRAIGFGCEPSVQASPKMWRTRAPRRCDKGLGHVGGSPGSPAPGNGLERAREGAVFVCTEDAFPSRRLQQLIAQQQCLRTDVPGDVVRKIQFGHQIFIEHAADVDTLLECVREKVPVLLSRGMARLVVIDSVAAPFRCEFDQAASALRARRLQALGAELRRLSCTFRSPVLCVNQVGPLRPRGGQGQGGRVLTAADPDLDPPGDGIRGGAGCGSRAAGVSGAPEGRGGGTRGSTRSTGQSAVFCLSVGGERVSPALGITWSNQLLVRLMADRQRPEEAASAPPRRTLRVVSAPHLPPSSCSYTVTAEGVRGTPGTESC
ncbi:DNA repair protein XRCC3 isoform X3 [Balaenoptera musculus]|uniref:DNA repair protein XRCC3 isoform X3 n=1 Tax=Balaenoptera musculus TaxID=9771 RepID=A0A8B8WVD7_BALMU|nr:DNA repair protein XRCC3 isoform X3 [Balaenoptera musculus]